MQTRKTWNRELKKIEVKGGTQSQLITFYSALYRTLLFPRTFHELNKKGDPIHFSPFDGRVHTGYLFTDLGLWDVYRAQFPLLVLIQPQTVIKVINGLLNIFDQGGWLPKWPSPGYRSMMIGSHSDSIIADTAGKGLNQFDLKKAFKAMQKHATQKGDDRYKGRVGIEYYQKLGFVPADRVKAAVSRTLEFAYDDYCIAQMARILGDQKTYQNYMNRALNYRLVFDPKTGFMRGKNSDGTWSRPFNPLAWGNGFVEGNAWHYLWSVQHDIEGLIDLLGGREKFIHKLDKLFNQSSNFVTGSYKFVIHEMREMKKINMGQYAHNNQPLHHVPYLYNYAGQPWKTQERVRRIMAELYGPDPAGLCGDEDTGQMSAWYVFSALGFYPVCPGQPIYVIGSPLFEKATIRLDNGKKFVVESINNSEKNLYIQTATLNGKEYNKTWLKHSDILKGGNLVFIMGPEPNKKWGSRPEDIPPSGMDYQE
jgi:predicted alpha-1,2-mannosidase